MFQSPPSCPPASAGEIFDPHLRPAAAGPIPMSLVVIGTLAYDSVETVHDRREDALGGSAMYFAVAAAPYVRPGLVGVVGGDWKASDMEMLAERGVDVSGVEVIEEGKTFRWGGRYEPDWNTRHTTYTDLNVLENFEPKLPEEYRSSDFVFLANAHPAVQMQGLAQVKEPEVLGRRHDEPLDRDRASGPRRAPEEGRRSDPQRRGGADAHRREQPHPGRQEGPRARAEGRDPQEGGARRVHHG